MRGVKHLIDVKKTCYVISGRKIHYYYSTYVLFQEFYLGIRKYFKVSHKLYPLKGRFKTIYPCDWMDQRLSPIDESN